MQREDIIDGIGSTGEKSYQKRCRSDEQVGGSRQKHLDNFNMQDIDIYQWTDERLIESRTHAGAWGVLRLGVSRQRCKILWEEEAGQRRREAE
jgi:hypothetical protein